MLLSATFLLALTATTFAAVPIGPKILKDFETTQFGYVNEISKHIQDGVRQVNGKIQKVVDGGANASPAILNGFHDVDIIQNNVHNEYEGISGAQFLKVPESVKQLIGCSRVAEAKAEAILKNGLSSIVQIIAPAENTRDLNLQIMYRTFNTIYTKLFRAGVHQSIISSVSLQFEQKLLDTWIAFLQVVIDLYNSTFRQIEANILELIRNTNCKA